MPLMIWQGQGYRRDHTEGRDARDRLGFHEHHRVSLEISEYDSRPLMRFGCQNGYLDKEGEGWLDDDELLNQIHSSAVDYDPERNDDGWYDKQILGLRDFLHSLWLAYHRAHINAAVREWLRAGTWLHENGGDDYVITRLAGRYGVISAHTGRWLIEPVDRETLTESLFNWNLSVNQNKQQPDRTQRIVEVGVGQNGAIER